MLDRRTAARLAEDVALRSAIPSRIDVETIPPGRRVPVAPAGYVTVLWSGSGSTRLADLRAASEGGDWSRFGELAARPSEIGVPPLPDDVPTAAAASVNPFALVPAIGEVAYQGRSVLAGAMIPPGSPEAIGRAQLPYLGTALEPGSFTATSYCQPEAKPLDFLVVVAQPIDRPLGLAAADSLQGSPSTIVVEPQWTPVARVVGGAVVKIAVEKAVDKAVDKAKDAQRWAEKERKEAAREHRQRERQAVERNREAVRERYRNAGLVGPAPRAERRSSPSPTSTSAELVTERRNELLDA